MNPTRVMVNGREVLLPGPEATPEQIKQAAGVDPNSMLVQQDTDANQFVQPGQRIKLAPGTHFADVPVFEYGADREVVFTEPDYQALQGHLFSDTSREQHAFMLAAPCVTPHRLRLLVREVLPSAGAQLDSQSGAYLQVNREHTAEVLERCLAEGLSLIEAHSHPFCSAGVAFSGTDTGNERLKFPYVAERIPDIHHATMVFGTHSVDAHLYDREQRAVVPIQCVRVVGHPLQVVPTTSSLQQDPPDPSWLRRYRALKASGVLPSEDDRAQRQVLAFGQGGQQRIASCRVGIVGAGGLGALAAQMLAYLGCREVVLVDDDRVEVSNLNRLVGALPADARLHTPKVVAAARMIREISPQTHVTAVQAKLQAPEAQEALKGCDVIFGALDNHGARLVLNQLCVSHLIPLIDMGTGIRVAASLRDAGRVGQASLLAGDAEGNSALTPALSQGERGNDNGNREQKPAATDDTPGIQAGGQVRLVIPGGFCLECIGGIDMERAAFDLMPPEGQARQRARGYVQGADVPAPAVIFLNSTVASLAVQEFVNLLCAFKPPHRLITWNAIATTAGPITGGTRREDCPTCGQGQLLASGDLARQASPQLPEEAPIAA